MSQPMPNLCMICKNMDTGASAYDAPKTCSAYPKGIPVSIFSGMEDHFTYKPGDSGIVFDPDPAHEAGLAAYLLFWYTFAEEGDEE